MFTQDASLSDSLTVHAFSSHTNMPWDSQHHSSHFRDSRHSMRARPDARKKPGALIHTGKIVPLMITSQLKNSLRRWMNPISENTITVMVVNGFFICSLLIIVCVSDNGHGCGIQIRLSLEMILMVRIPAA